VQHEKEQEEGKKNNQAYKVEGENWYKKWSI